MTIQPIRIQFKTACESLGVSREALHHKVRTDASFSRSIREGDTKQAPVYFDYAELVDWHNSQKQSLAVLEA
ncbi:transcriptional regulator [Acinetobacter sp. CWB-B33]|uniref:transcriptional regulator n=1 Tax=Acinetobacter sp. CWB-B33 TaxID=2815724 RepID=UPI0031FE8AF3